SQTAEYALRAALALARDHPKAMTTQQIAKQMQIPASYLAKVLQALARGQVVRSQRGLGGGFSLRRPPEQITLLEVLEPVDPIKRIKSCPLDVDDHQVNLCPLHRRLDAAIAQVREAFSKTTLAELVYDENPCPHGINES
ncbi:MAG: Rrf2 family transcriptional regulator, partial [Deltaproteobacteria bacterium]|nr:Rrf2 family transcriptional regulator [Deltaproteobacteria bacterium]